MENVLTDSGACLKNQRGFQLQLYPAVRSRDDRERVKKKGTSPPKDLLCWVESTYVLCCRDAAMIASLSCTRTGRWLRRETQVTVDHCMARSDWSLRCDLCVQETLDGGGEVLI